MPNVGDPDASSPTAPQDPDWLPPEINTGVAHPARVYDYWLGGKVNFAADRALGDAVVAAMPETRFGARANRALVRWRGRRRRPMSSPAISRRCRDMLATS